MIDDPNYLNVVSDIHENNRIRDESINELDSIFIAFLKNDSSYENRFLIGLQVDVLEMKSKEVAKKYKLTNKKVKEYLGVLHVKLRDFVIQEKS